MLLLLLVLVLNEFGCIWIFIHSGYSFRMSFHRWIVGLLCCFPVSPQSGPALLPVKVQAHFQCGVEWSVVRSLHTPGSRSTCCSLSNQVDRWIEINHHKRMVNAQLQSHKRHRANEIVHLLIYNRGWIVLESRINVLARACLTNMEKA